VAASLVFVSGRSYNIKPMQAFCFCVANNGNTLLQLLARQGIDVYINLKGFTVKG